MNTLNQRCQSYCPSLANQTNLLPNIIIKEGYRTVDCFALISFLSRHSEWQSIFHLWISHDRVLNTNIDRSLELHRDSNLVICSDAQIWQTGESGRSIYKYTNWVSINKWDNIAISWHLHSKSSTFGTFCVPMRIKMYSFKMSIYRFEGHLSRILKDIYIGLMNSLFIEARV